MQSELNADGLAISSQAVVERLEPLASPPINEVVCGLIFPGMDIDPVFVGTYWNLIRAEFPGKQIHPAVSEQPSFVLVGTPPLRTWLISKDDVFVIQIQHDRFYLNWRARGQSYPRFSDHGVDPGLLSLCLARFEHFSSFCEQQLGKKPEPMRFELSKLDHFYAGRHWNGFQDLATMIPWLSRFAAFTRSEQPSLMVRLTERRAFGDLVVAVETGVVPVEDHLTPLLKMETRLLASLQGFANARDAFSEANDQLNQVFSELIPKDQRAKRFG